MIYSIYYVKDTGSKKDRQVNYHGILQNLDSIEQVKQQIKKDYGKCVFEVYGNVNSVFSYGEMSN